MKAAVFFAALSAALTSASPSPVQQEKRATTVSSSGSLPTVTVKGNAFYTGSTRFFVKGIDYQPGGASKVVDPIADATLCQRDIIQFKKLGINTIRVYSVDNTANHDVCMNALAAAGIYLALDINTPKYSLRRDKPGQSYNPTYLQNVFATIEAFAGYSNTLLFFSGNEVINDANTTSAAPYVKAVTRDMRQYMRTRGLRQVPVGYSAADVESNRFEMAQYMNCGTDDQRSDFYAFNDYSWCDESTFQISGWDKKVQQYSNYSIPIFLSEWGCITNTRTFGAAKSIYGSDMAAVYSGGLVYEYSEEDNKYGLVTINSDGTITPKDDFAALQSAFAAVSVPTDAAGAKTSGGASSCPANSDTFNISPWTGAYLPAMPSGATQYLTNGAGTGAGLTGTGSQDATGGSTTTATPGSASGTTVSTSAATSSGAAVALSATDLGVGPYVSIGVMLVSMLAGVAIF